MWLLGHLEKKYGQDHILFADEAGFYSTERYEWGWAKKGEPCDIPRPGGRGHKRNWISAIRASDQSWQMPWVVTGNINRMIVEQWLEALGKSLQQGQEKPKPYVLVWDNASFHLGGDLEAIAMKYQIRIIQLPAYSPDLNPIGQCWATLKHYARLAMGKGSTLDDAIDYAFNRQSVAD
ncbi:transposase [Thiothrix nivea]|uniref:transposase n=1 Tax=Thiothrix nivea TaxID=1031 RepID=UPI0009DACBDF